MDYLDKYEKLYKERRDHVLKKLDEGFRFMSLSRSLKRKFCINMFEAHSVLSRMVADGDISMRITKNNIEFSR